MIQSKLQLLLGSWGLVLQNESLGPHVSLTFQPVKVIP